MEGGFQWWQKGPIYHIYPKSFFSGGGQNSGDLKGIKAKVGYLKSLNVGAVWISPFFTSPMVDNGYDISDYCDVDSSFGNMQNFEELVTALHSNEIKIILDFVPNHSSDRHEWFRKSVNKIHPYTDYYVWQPGSKGVAPNNWVSVFGGSAWTWNEKRGEYYLHQFYKEQPDLNLRNEAVVKELEDVLEFWVVKEVDGFRIDAVPHFFEDPEFRDEPVIDGKPIGSYDSRDHTRTYNLQPETSQLLEKFRKVVGKDRLILTESYVKPKDLVDYYGKIDENGVGSISQMPLNFGLISTLAGDVTPTRVQKDVSEYLKIIGKAWPNFNMGNHDLPRIGSRIGADLSSAANVLLLTLPGTPITYYGEEIGMVDHEGLSGSSEDSYLSKNRDPCRTPMQWNATINGGFSSSEPWLPLNPNYKVVNVEVQSSSQTGHLNVYKILAGLRKSGDPHLIGGGITFVENSKDLLCYERRNLHFPGSPYYFIIINFNNERIKLKGSMDVKDVVIRTGMTKNIWNGAVEAKEAIVTRLNP